MRKAKHSRMGKRLITAMKEVVAHVGGKVELPMRYIAHFHSWCEGFTVRAWF